MIFELVHEGFAELKPKTKNRKPETGNREPGTGNLEAES
jgi:hypothetical protein